MRNDQIFVLLLVVLLPMSGCFGAGGIGEAEGAEDSTTNTTVVNNFYNNTTVIESTTPLNHQFSNGTIVITTSPHEVVEVISLDAVRPSGSFNPGWSTSYYSESWTSQWDALVNINCTMINDNATIDLGDSGLNYGGFATSDTLPSDGGVCIYTIQNQWDYSAQSEANIWPLNGMISMTYQIHSVI